MCKHWDEMAHIQLHWGQCLLTTHMRDTKHAQPKRTEKHASLQSRVSSQLMHMHTKNNIYTQHTHTKNHSNTQNAPLQSPVSSWLWGRWYAWGSPDWSAWHLRLLLLPAHTNANKWKEEGYKWYVWGSLGRSAWHPRSPLLPMLINGNGKKSVGHILFDVWCMYAWIGLRGIFNCGCFLHAQL